ncbi:hypothetical protein MYU51_020841 [Penicillium brevicompactum]|uniref:uncharacterized protein n=1 Tax=Penicillium brevicompactum TaxID=5074 RepID=UPI002541B36F|nr:uncharacterized protein N7506_008376 [Penicillium brevicompactum]KAJ5325274.1 hypothetical protein N7506_008376 [Penicillium brevicompactum]
MDEVHDEIKEELSQTEFACPSLSRLSGGTANFVYRGKLASTGESIVIKHAKDYLASNKSFNLDITRCEHEIAILRALDSLSPHSKDDVTVKTPRLLYSNQATHTQVLEDLPNSLDLKTFLLSGDSGSLSESSALAIGRALGSWLRSLHVWAAEKGQASSEQFLRENKPMQQLKFYANYTLLVESVSSFPAILEESRGIFEQVRDLAAAELERRVHDDEYGVIHGDFWTGNVLVQRSSLDTAEGSTNLFVVDWELSQVGNRALDLGQMIAELYETKLFKHLDIGLQIIQGFTAGYGPISDEMAFRTAIHVGVHLICWGSRVPGWGSQEQVKEVVKVGRDIIVQAWAKEKTWFEEGSLGCLFAI